MLGFLQWERRELYRDSEDRMQEGGRGLYLGLLGFLQRSRQALHPVQ